MHVLLTGAAGFVGRVALELLNERHQVTAFDIQNLKFLLKNKIECIKKQGGKKILKTTIVFRSS